MTPDTGILTHLLGAFLAVFNGGWSALQPSAMSLFGILVGLELTLSGLWWALSGDDAVKALLKKLLVIGLFFFFIQQWPTLTTTTLQSFARIGATAGGASNSSLNGLTDPSTIVAQGFNVIQPLSDKVDALTQGTWTALKNLGTIMQLGLAMIGILFAFFLLGIQCFLVYLEFYIVAVLSLILLPFGVFRHSAFIAEKAFGAVIAHGIKLMVLAFVIAIAQPVLQQITMPTDFSLRDAWCTLLAVMTICFLAWHAPSMAAGLLTGSPTFGAGQAIGGALEAGGAAMLGAAGVAAAGRAVVGGAGATIAASSALKTGASIGAARAANAGAGPVGQTVGAVAGAAKVAASPLTTLADRMSQRVSDGQLTAHAAHGLEPARTKSSSDAVPPSPTNTVSPATGVDQSQTSSSGPSASAASSSAPGASPGYTSARGATVPSTEVPARRLGGAVGSSPSAPTPTETLDASRITPAQRRVDDVIAGGSQSNLGASGHRGATAPAGAAQATERAARADDSRDEPASDDATSEADTPVQPAPAAASRIADEPQR